MDAEGSTRAGPDDLDFWLGDWTCAWEGGGGRNVISRELGGRVVVERFESDAPQRWSGMSLSVFDERSGWRQTWVDSTGNYWAFGGGPHEEGFAFSTVEAEPNGVVTKRMVFSDIAEDSLTWRWERSPDGGRTWEVLWTISYTRATEGP